MTLRYKLLSAVSAITMAMAIGGAQAAELLTAEQLDTINAGASAGAAVAATNSVGVAAGNPCNPCTAQLLVANQARVTSTGPGAVGATN